MTPTACGIEVVLQCTTCDSFSDASFVPHCFVTGLVAKTLIKRKNKTPVNLFCSLVEIAHAHQYIKDNNV